MQLELNHIGWILARWNVAVFVIVAALVYEIGGLDPAVGLIG